MKKVLVFRLHLLERSETFIRDQVLACASWRALLVGFVRARDGLPIDDMELRLLDGTRPALVGKIHRALLADLGATRRSFVAICRREAPDLLHAHFGTDAVIFWPTLRRLTQRVIVTLHGQDITIHREAWERNRLRFSKRLYPERLLRMADDPRVYFVAVSDDIRQAAIGYGIAPERITVQHIGIDLTRFRFSGLPIAARPPRIVFVGRLVEKKGVEYLIRAFARVSQQIPGAQLAVLGGGPLGKSLQALAAELGVPVEFCGGVDRSEVSRQLANARVLCLPSVTAANGDAEGLGMVILEAQACGLPVVTSARGGKTEAIVDGRTGFAFAERDVEALTGHLCRLLRDDDLATAMSAAAIPHIAAHFDIRECTRKLEQLYDRLATH